MTLHAFFMEEDEQGIEDAITNLSATDGMRLKAITAPRRRREFVLSRWLVRFALSRTLGGHGWSLVGEPGHRPVGRDALGRIHRVVNLSHSRGGILCTVAAESPLQLGCDLEAVRERSASSWRRISALERAHPVFSGADRQWLVEGSASQRHERLCMLWTLKEAIGKATGRGILRGGVRELEPDWRALTNVLAQVASAAHSSAANWTAVAVAGPWHVQLLRRTQHWLAVATPTPRVVNLHVVQRADLIAADI